MNNRLLLPLAVLQGLWVLQRTPRLPAPSGQAGRHGNSDGRFLRIVGVGDSIMAGTGVREQRNSLTATFARLLHERSGRGVEWHVHGANGATSFRVLHEHAPAAASADVYLISVGVNDVTRAVDSDRFASHLRGIYDLLRRKAPESVIIFGGLPPMNCFPALPWPLSKMVGQRASELQAVAAAVTSRYERAPCFSFPATMAPEQFASDGFHPAEAACLRWAEGLLELWPEHRTVKAPSGRASMRTRARRTRAASSLHERSADSPSRLQS